MKKETIIINVVLGGLLLCGCGQKNIKTKDITSVNLSKVEQKSKTIEKNTSDLVVEVKPIVDKKLEVVTKVKPEIAIVATEKLKKGETPVIVVDPIEKGTPVEEVDILPVVDNTVGVITKVKPTVEIVEEIPVEENSTAVIIEPVVR